MVAQKELIRTILGLCARDRGHDRMYELLERAIDGYQKKRYPWEELIRQAEFQGVAPLLYKHISTLDFTLPFGHHRILRSLYQRSRLANHIRNQVVTDILESFHKQCIDVLLIKGIALSNDIYESPALRPMRDIDLLVKRKDLEAAYMILTNQGFVQDLNHDIPDDYYHLPPMQKSLNGLPVNIEIHHKLMPSHPLYPKWRYESFQHSSHTLLLNGGHASTLNHEDNLYYIYLHGLKAPLTYEPYRLIHIADLVSLVEMYETQVDWDKVDTNFPSFRTILSLLHFITPWQSQLIEKLKLIIDNPPEKAGAPYSGWPRQKIKDTPVKKIPLLLKNTLSPSRWWLQIYYPQRNADSYLFHQYIEHLRTIWRWIKSYRYK